MTELPPDGALDIGTIRLHGHRLHAAENVEHSAERSPVMWITDDPVASAGDAWLRLRPLAQERNLVCFLVDPEDDHWLRYGWFDMGERVEGWELDARAVLEHWWDVPEFDEEEADLAEAMPATFPGLARPTTEPTDIARLEAQVRELRGRYVAVVVGERQGDVPARIGWTRHNAMRGAQGLTTVLWSWEARFGALLVQVGYETLDVFVSRPVLEPDHAWQVACEHYAFCPDIVDQGGGSIDAQALEILGSTRWTFWWD